MWDQKQTIENKEVMNRPLTCRPVASFLLRGGGGGGVGYGRGCPPFHTRELLQFLH